jgi:hypothetical protein
MSEQLTYKQAEVLALQETKELVSAGKTLFDIASMYADRVWDDIYTNACDALLDLLQETFPEFE